MSKIPTGRVTFLFTDIEGSTKLAQKDQDTLHAALEIHNDILLKAFESNSGFVFEIVGDAFCCAFEKAEDAVKAAVEAQINLTGEKWKEAVIKIRIGIHTGNAEWNGNRYMGYITLARTARIMSAAYGEQILVSKDTFEFYHKSSGTTDKQSPDLREIDINFRDLGERRLKDLNQPVRLYQILSHKLRSEFPPLKTLDARPNNLPVQLTNFIGRDKEIKHAKELLNDTRLLTLTGSGGAGKTRFALQTGADLIDDFANGVWLVELAGVSDPEYLPQSVINSLGLKEEQKKSCVETLADYLKDKEILIIMDNCEHIINACSELAEKLLTLCPDLKIIATSREALNCSGEQIYRIPSLSHPDTGTAVTPEDLIQFESARLFIERALAVNPHFRVTNENVRALAEICSRLDGVPLAIELAAARIKILSVEKIHERLDDRFKLLTGGKRTALPRQQTLRAMIDWSYDLLSEEEKTLWSRLGVFSGGWTIEAAEEICSDDKISKNEILELLGQLTEKSIIIFNEDKERYRILESIKQYGLEKLISKNEIYNRYLNYYLEFSKIVKSELESYNVKLSLDRVEADNNNFQSAIEWAVKNNEIEKAGMVALSLGKFWEIRGNYTTGQHIIEIIMNEPDKLSISAKINLLNWKGFFSYRQGDFYHARKNFEESLALSKQNGDKNETAVSLNGLGNVANSMGDYEHAQKFLEESLAIRKEAGDDTGMAKSYNNLGNVAYYLGNYEQAEKYFEECRLISEKMGDKLGIAKSLNNLGNSAIYRGNNEQALKYYEDSLEIFREIGNKLGISDSLNGIAGVALNIGDYEKALRYYEECLALVREIKDKHGISSSYLNLGNISYLSEDYENARKYFEESLLLHRELGDKRGIATSVLSIGITAFSDGDYDLAQKYYKESLKLHREIGDKRGMASTLNGLGNVSKIKGDYEQAYKYYKESLELFGEMGIKDRMVSSLNNIAGIMLHNKNYFLAVKLLSASEKAVESAGAVLEKSERNSKDDTIAKLNKLLSAEEFEKFWEEGKKLTLEEAAELALKKDDDE